MVATPTLSVCIIVKNEQDFLRQCLLSVRDIADEIIIVDTGSTDATLEIAQEFTDKIYHFPWNDDFAAARNESLKYATGDWILVLDADEELDEQGKETLRQTLSSSSSTTAEAFYLPQLHYTNIYTTHPDFIPINTKGNIEFKGYYPCFVIRLFRRSPTISFCYCVHETIYPALKHGGKTIQHLRVPIHHYQERKGAPAMDQKQEFYFHLSLHNIEQHPSYAKSYNDVAVYYNKYKGDLTMALEYCRKAVELEPENVDYILHLSYLLRDQGKYIEAIKILEPVAARVEDERLFRALGYLYYKGGTFGEAITMYQYAIMAGSPLRETLLRQITVLEQEQRKVG